MSRRPLCEEEVVELMNAVDSASDLDFDSDDSVADKDYIPDDIIETNRYIDDAIQAMALADESYAFIDPAASLTLNESQLALIEVVADEVADLSTRTSGTSTNAFKPLKRPRSPLPTIEDTGPSFVPNSGGFTGVAKEIKKNFDKLLWKKKSLQLHINEVAFRGNSKLPNEIMQLNTPLRLFSYFFDDDIVEMIRNETNRAAHTKNIETRFTVSKIDIRQYMGILMYMSVYRYPSMNSYWSRHAFGPIANTMSRKKFMEIKKYLCFVDESQRKKKGEVGYDPLFRIRPLAKKLNERFDSVPKSARLCVDEQMCSTKTKHHLRQYMPNKPHKWGVKLFVLCDSHGYAYRFEVYNGKGDNVVLPAEPDLGATPNVVVRLSQTIPNFANHIVYFDNFYTSIPLLVYLRSRGIFALGTVRANRVPDCKLPNDKAVQKESRGYSTEYITNCLGVTVSSVLWKDNKNVRLVSTYVGIKPFDRTVTKQPSQVSRYDRKDKKHVEIDCPEIIKEYNRHMGGVDLMDGLMGRYHIRAKSRNIMTRLFYHFVDMAVTNAYILYHRIHAQNREDLRVDEEDKLFELPTFREKIAEGLVTFSEDSLRVGRRPQTPIEVPVTAVGKKAKHPIEDVRFDGIGHMSLWLPKQTGRKTCKHCKSSVTQHICRKCGIHLCNSNTKNCFAAYHGYNP